MDCQLSPFYHLVLAEIHCDFVENYCPKLSFTLEFACIYLDLILCSLGLIPLLVYSALEHTFCIFTCLLVGGRQKSICDFETNQKVTSNLLTSYMTICFPSFSLFHCEIWYICKFQNPHKTKQTAVMKKTKPH